MSRLLPVLTVVVIVTLSGVVHGVWTNRWGTAKAVQEAAEKLEKNVPMTIGEWDGQAKEMTEREIAIGEIDGYVSRSYVNRRTGSMVSLLIVCGRPGPISVHTPDVCYGGAGYEQVGPTPRYAAPGMPAEFKVLQLRKQN